MSASAISATRRGSHHGSATSCSAGVNRRAAQNCYRHSAKFPRQHTMRQKRIVTSSAALHEHTTLAYWLPGCDAYLACFFTAASKSASADGWASECG